MIYRRGARTASETWNLLQKYVFVSIEIPRFFNVKTKGDLIELIAGSWFVNESIYSEIERK